MSNADPISAPSKTVRPIVIETLGDLAEHSMGLAWHCAACHRTLGLTLDEAIRRWGRDQVYVRWRPPIRCAECGSREIAGSVRANTVVKSHVGSPFDLQTR